MSDLSDSTTEELLNELASRCTALLFVAHLLDHGAQTYLRWAAGDKFECIGICERAKYELIYDLPESTPE